MAGVPTTPADKSLRVNLGEEYLGFLKLSVPHLTQTHGPLENGWFPFGFRIPQSTLSKQQLEKMPTQGWWLVAGIIYNKPVSGGRSSHFGQKPWISQATCATFVP